MPRVLVLGATGYLGQAVTSALVQSGLHRVYGLCRSSAKAHLLAAAEVTPVVCEDPANSPEPYLSAITNFRINVVVDCTAAYGDSAKFLAQVKKLGQQHVEAFKANGIASPQKIGFIYVSGAWVHGDSRRPISDLDSVGTASAQTQPLDIVAWRPELERQVLAARDILDVLIVRPAMMHGRSSAGWGALFGPVFQAIAGKQTEIQVPAPSSSQSPVIHVDDVAAAIALGVGKIALLGGSGVYPIFDLVSSTENVRDIIEAFARAVQGEEAKVKLEFVGPGDNVYLKALGASVNYDSARARELLGWEPKRRGFVGEMDVYAAAWVASQKAG
jgi:nucleoside-diphosphate-sugar epimerase